MKDEELLVWLDHMRFAPVSTSVQAYRSVIDELAERLNPKRPKQYKSHPEDIFMCQCGSAFIVNSLGTRYPYCPICGARQDWSDSDEMV